MHKQLSKFRRAMTKETKLVIARSGPGKMPLTFKDAQEEAFQNIVVRPKAKIKNLQKQVRNREKQINSISVRFDKLLKERNVLRKLLADSMERKP